MRNCNICGHNNPSGLLFCGMCGGDLKTQLDSSLLRDTESEPICIKCSYPLIDASIECPNCGDAGTNKTKDVEKKVVPTTRLIVLSAFGETKDSKEIPIIDSELLNREYINPEDNSLSNSQHARVFKDQKSGKWKIENLASNKTVFKRVTDIEEISDGDILMFGKNNYLEFRTEEE